MSRTGASYRNLVVVGDRGVGERLLLTLREKTLAIYDHLPTRRAGFLPIFGTSTGKTSLLLAFTKGRQPWEYLPQVMDDTQVDIETSGEIIPLTLLDAYSGPNSMREWMLPLSYPGAHGFLICFALDDSDSLENVTGKWMPELAQFSEPNTPILLIGCKKDIRDGWVELSQTHITTERGSQAAQTIKAYMYLECSASTGEGIREVFLHALEAVKHHERRRNPRRRTMCIVA